MIKIKISYEYPEERQYILNKLGNNVRDIREPRKQEKKYKRIYIELKRILE